MFRRRRETRWLPAEAAASLVEIAILERGIAHILAGWAVKLPDFAAKRLFAMQMHRAMERATSLRGRINGLCWAVAGEPKAAAGLRSVLISIDRASSSAELMTALYRWLFPRLIDLYQNHLRNTDPIGDQPSLEMIGRILPQLRQDWRDGRTLGRTLGRAKSGALRELDALWRKRGSGEPVTLAEALWPPVDRVPAAVRPDGLRAAQPGSLGLLPADPVGDPVGIAMALHKELDEEYTTLELIARNSYEHPDMPWAFHQAMARQASDEARHALIILRLMAARGVRHGDFPISTSSYDGIYAFEPCEAGSRRELLWRMLVRQTFEEGLAIDHLPLEIDRRRAAGQADIAAGFEYILRDEVFHAQSGLRWTRELLGGDSAALMREREEAVRHLAERAEAARAAFVMSDLDSAMAELVAIDQGRERRGGTPPERPLNRTGRAQAGYTDDDIAQVIEWGFANRPRAF